MRALISQRSYTDVMINMNLLAVVTLPSIYQFISMLVTTVKLHGAEAYDSQMKMHTSTSKQTSVYQEN